MKKYFDPENERYRFHVRECINGYAIQVLVVSSEENIPLSPSVAAQLQISLPDTYRIQSCTRNAAEEQLDELAKMNGWEAVE